MSGSYWWIFDLGRRNGTIMILVYSYITTTLVVGHLDRGPQLFMASGVSPSPAYIAPLHVQDYCTRSQYS